MTYFAVSEHPQVLINGCSKHLPIGCPARPLRYTMKIGKPSREVLFRNALGKRRGLPLKILIPSCQICGVPVASSTGFTSSRLIGRNSVSRQYPTDDDIQQALLRQAHHRAGICRR